jgi:hypothetical protein
MSPQRRSSRDVERGASVAAAVAAKSHSIVAAAIGGGGGNGLGWDFGSSGDLGMISVPTSPTAQSPVMPQQLSRFVTSSPGNGVEYIYSLFLGKLNLFISVNVLFSCSKKVRVNLL